MSGGDCELQELVQNLDQDKIQRMTSNEGINWHWNPQLAPHFGGMFERMIGSAKRAIQAILGNADVKVKELMAMFTKVKSLLNSRPLMATGNDLPCLQCMMMLKKFLGLITKKWGGVN